MRPTGLGAVLLMMIALAVIFAVGPWLVVGLRWFGEYYRAYTHWVLR